MNAKLQTEFGERLVKLHDGRTGLRGGLACEVKAVEDATLDFIATDETVDRYGERILSTGWQLDAFRANPVVVDSHDYSSVLKILGNSPQLTIVDGRMHNRVRFAMDNPLGAIAYKMAAAGFIKSESVGFIPLEWQPAQKAGDPARTFTKQELLEISLVAIPANPGATIGLALKSGVLASADVRELATALKHFCNSQERSPDPARATVAGADIAQLLPLARAFADVAKRA